MRGRKAAQTRIDRDRDARGAIPAELLGLYDSVKWRLKKNPRATRDEVFLSWLHDHPEALADYERKSEAERERARKRLEVKCFRAYEQARSDLRRQKFRTLAKASPKTREALSECARSFDDERYDPDEVEREIRLAETGAPF